MHLHLSLLEALLEYPQGLLFALGADIYNLFDNSLKKEILSRQLGIVVEVGIFIEVLFIHLAI